MAKKKRVGRTKRTPRMPPLRTWDVELASGNTESVTAHDMSVYEGLSFTRIFGTNAEGDREWLTVRAFQMNEWKHAKLVEQPEPPPEISES